MKLRPTRIDPRDKRFHFHKLFGSNTTPTYREIDNDAHLTIPDQDADGRPNSCSSYAVTDIATDQDRVVYSHDFQMFKTMELMGTTDPSKGADARTAISVPIDIGLLNKDLEPATALNATEAGSVNPSNWPVTLDTQTLKKPAYIPITPEKGQDWFDAIYNALDKGFTVAMATQWSPDFEAAIDILPENPTNLYWGHMYKITGVSLLNGLPYFKVKSWQGQKYQEGICRMSRTLCNSLMGTWGAYAATLAKLPSDVIDQQKQKKITLLEHLIALYQNLLGMMNLTTGFPPESNADLFVQAAKNSLGKDLSAGTGVPYYVACALSVNKVHTEAFGFPIGGGASTADLYKALLTSPYFKQVDTPEPGCVVISPTGYGTNPQYPHGHTGCVGYYGICSNDSATGLFSENYTVDSWTKQFHDTEGYPVFYFKRL